MGVIINNQNTKILGFALKGRPSIPSANKKYETIEVEGRDGSLTRFINYEDLKFSLTFNILFQDDIKQKLREIKGLMANAKTLSFDDSPNFFYKIKQAQVSDTESIIKRHGVFSVDFVADSFEYEASSVLEPVYPNLNLGNNTKNFVGAEASSAIRTGFIAIDTGTVKTQDGDATYLTFNPTINGTDWFRYVLKPDSSTPNMTSITVKPNIQYTFSAWMKGSGEHIIFAYNSWTSAPATGSLRINLTSDWKLYTFTVTSSSVIPDKTCQFFIRSNIGTEINLKKPKVEEGTTATSWMPSKSEEYIYTAKLLIRNNTTYFSQPIIKIFGNGNIKLYINDELIELKNVMDGIVINSEKQEAYLADVNKNSQMVGNFPNFEIGENQIICTGKVNKVEILPNWRWLT